MLWWNIKHFVVCSVLVAIVREHCVEVSSTKENREEREFLSPQPKGVQGVKDAGSRN